MDALNTYETGLRERVVSSMLHEFLDVTTSIPQDEWVRCGHDEGEATPFVSNQRTIDLVSAKMVLILQFLMI